jgi:myo-inositol-1-phosphate synthase
MTWSGERYPAGRLGVLFAGLGSISTTLIAGVHAIRQGLGRPIGSLALLGTLEAVDQENTHPVYIRDAVHLARLDDLVFGGWDVVETDGYAAARRAAVLEPALIDALGPELAAIRPWRGVVDQSFTTRSGAMYCKTGDDFLDLAAQVREDIVTFQRQHQLERSVLLWCGSTEPYLEPASAHETLAGVEAAMRERNHVVVPPSMIYAYAALSLGMPFVNATPSRTIDIPAMAELALRTGAPMAGKDLKTGQTFMKTILAPGLRDRALGLEGWFSTNILGNGDGETLDNPAAFRTKQESKLAVLKSMLRADIYPDLYKHLHHDVRINYYPPAGDNKESWDVIDIFGWLGYRMSIRVDFLCRDSILAAPLLLDLALFMDLAKRSSLAGPQEWLSFYFKSPMASNGHAPEHELSLQLGMLRRELGWLAGAPREALARAEGL